MPSIKVVPTSDSSRVGYTQVQQAFGRGAPGAIQIVTTQRRRAARGRDRQGRPRRRAGHAGRARRRRRRPGPGHPQRRPVSQGRRRDRRPPALRRCRRARWSAARSPRTTTSRQLLSAKTPLVIGVVLALGFLLLLVALQAPIIAAFGVLTNLLATGAAFGVARLIFQEGHGSGLLGFEPQGFLDAWGPVFFFAMIFAISMDYTVFLLSSAKEHWDRSHDPHEAMVGAVAHSGRVVFAAAGGDGRGLLHLRALRPAAAQGDGRHPRRRRPARRRAGPPAARAGAAAPAGQVGLVAAQAAATASCPTSASATPRRPTWPSSQARRNHHTRAPRRTGSSWACS